MVGRRDVADRGVQPLVVVPVDPLGGGQLDLGTAARDGRGWPGPSQFLLAPWPTPIPATLAAVTGHVPVAPSTYLRHWYGHDPTRFAEFTDRYRTELADREHADALDRLRTLARAGPLTLLTAARDVDHAHTAVLVGLLTNDVDQAFDRDTEQPRRFVADKRPGNSRTSD